MKLARTQITTPALKKGLNLKQAFFNDKLLVGLFYESVSKKGLKALNLSLKGYSLFYH
jgi:hypothetical protein